jgi:hypothetical protein
MSNYRKVFAYLVKLPTKFLVFGKLLCPIDFFEILAA